MAKAVWLVGESSSGARSAACLVVLGGGSTIVLLGITIHGNSRVPSLVVSFFCFQRYDISAPIFLLLLLLLWNHDQKQNVFATISLCTDSFPCLELSSFLSAFPCRVSVGYWTNTIDNTMQVFYRGIAT